MGGHSGSRRVAPIIWLMLAKKLGDARVTRHIAGLGGNSCGVVSNTVLSILGHEMG